MFRSVKKAVLGLSLAEPVGFPGEEGLALLMGFEALPHCAYT